MPRRKVWSTRPKSPRECQSPDNGRGCDGSRSPQHRNHHPPHAVIAFRNQSPTPALLLASQSRSLVNCREDGRQSAHPDIFNAADAKKWRFMKSRVNVSICVKYKSEDIKFIVRMFDNQNQEPTARSLSRPSSWISPPSSGVQHTKASGPSRRRDHSRITIW